MNRKLTEADRKEIRRMLGTLTHAEIARRFGVCSRTIDREAAWHRAHTATVYARFVGGVLVSASFRVGEALEGVDAGELLRIAEASARSMMQGEGPLKSSRNFRRRFGEAQGGRTAFEDAPQSTREGAEVVGCLRGPPHARGPF